jgi:hypothetical protein
MFLSFDNNDIHEAQLKCNTKLTVLTENKDAYISQKENFGKDINTKECSNNEIRQNIENLSVQLGSLNNYNLVERKNKLNSMEQEIFKSTELNISEGNFPNKLKKYEKEFNDRYNNVQKENEKTKCE